MISQALMIKKGKTIELIRIEPPPNLYPQFYLNLKVWTLKLTFTVVRTGRIVPLPWKYGFRAQLPINLIQEEVCVSVCFRLCDERKWCCTSVSCSCVSPFVRVWHRRASDGAASTCTNSVGLKWAAWRWIKRSTQTKSRGTDFTHASCKTRMSAGEDQPHVLGVSRLLQAAYWASKYTFY